MLQQTLRGWEVVKPILDYLRCAAVGGKLHGNCGDEAADAHQERVAGDHILQIAQHMQTD